MRSPSPPAAERPARLLAPALALFALLLLAYSGSIGLRASEGASITGDEPFYLLTTQSLLRDGDLDLRDQYARREYRSFFDHPEGLWRQSVPGPDGRLLSPHDPGLSIVLLPGFGAAGLPGAQVQVLVLTAAAFALTFVLAARTTARPAVAWLATAAVAVTPTAFVYATEIYPEAPAALALVAGVLLVTAPGRGGPVRAAGLAATLTALAWLGVKYVPLAAVVAAFGLARATGRGRVALLGVGAVSAVAFVWWHLATFGGLTPYGVNSAFAGASTGELLGEHADFADRVYRLWGLFIDRRFGVGRWAPILLLALPGLAMLWCRGGIRRLAIVLVGVQLLIATFFAITMMGWWFPGRTLMTVLPLLALPLAAVLDRGGIAVRATGAALGAYTAAVTVALVVAVRAGHVTVAVDPFDLRTPLFTFPAGLFPQYTAWGTDTIVLTAIWLGGAAAAAWWAARRRRTVPAPAASPVSAG